MLYIVTVDLGKRFEVISKHDRFHKKRGPCPIQSLIECTDITGAHHSAVVEARSEQEAKDVFCNCNTTRVEVVNTNIWKTE